MAQTTLRDYLQETEDAISSGHIDEALTNCQYILAYFPESLEAQRLLGEVYLAQGNLEEAQRAFDWVLTNDPENVIVYCDRALISERMSDYETALDCYQQAYELSRGNSQIRQEFNQMSMKAGQQGFMFSRAGLARLYMRGDLLTQAIQEWEVVLAGAPDRLDARTGLLETYWREGMYERVSQLALQILQDVPGCLKALLLLAFVTAAKDMQRAQEYLQRVEALDPDLVLAQELFADMIVNQPNEPFLKMLKKLPVSLEPAKKAEDAVVHAPAVSKIEDAFVSLNTVPNVPQVSTTSSTFTAWNDHNRSENGAVSPSQQDALSQQDVLSAPLWTREFTLKEDMPSISSPLLEISQDHLIRQIDDKAHIDSWDSFNQSHISQKEAPFEFEKLLQASVDDVFVADIQDQAKPEPAPWESLDDFTNFNDQDEDTKGGTGEASTDLVEPVDPWGSSANAQSASPLPTWLSMLTQGERQQISGVVPPVPAIEPELPMVHPPALPVLPSVPDVEKEAAQPVVPVVPTPSADMVQKEEPQPITLELDEEEPFSFGPEWLKSLGATIIDEESSDDLTPSVSSTILPKSVVPELEPKPQVTYELQKAVEPEPRVAYESWKVAEPEPQVAYEPWVEHIADPAEKMEQSIITTLEELEQGLLSQGFTQLEPNSLAVIAQTQELKSEPKADLVLSQEVPPIQKDYKESQEPALSSALAKLGNFLQQSSPQAKPFVVPAASTQAELSEPAWAASLRSSFASTPVPHVQEEVPSMVTAAQNNVPANFAVDPISTPLPQAHLSPEELPSRVEASSNFAFELTPTTQLGTHSSRDAFQIPQAKPNALLDSELETTMKRPAVRLQPMQQRSAAQREQFMPTSKIHTGERAERANKAADGNLSYQDRLLKGYQHQLVGDYDEAMQEYRIIIRSAPELLGEVVSNVRALLKLASKYSAGYRVLGDAYMRQGEYLQAMEAYNKALTMAKKAKG